MPLGAEGESFGALYRNGLDDPIGRDRLGGEARGEPADTLAMQTVHHGLALPQDLLENAAGSNCDRVGGAVFHVEILDLAGTMIETALAPLDLGFERAAERNVELLVASADAEERDAALDHRLDHAERQSIAMVVVRLIIGARLAAVMGRMHIRDRPSHDDAVEVVEEGAEVHGPGDCRNHYGEAAGHLRNGAGVLVAERMKYELRVLVGVGREPDEG